MVPVAKAALTGAEDLASSSTKVLKGPAVRTFVNCPRMYEASAPVASLIRW